jgi:hypothetical protein
MADDYTLEITLKDRKDPVRVSCDRHEEDTYYLNVFRGDRQIGKYKLNEIVGYHEEQAGDLSF